ncbi:hypothetical protein HPP92_001961 [Vanilla planifolia]|uniref:Uncharacterized protein n=1 Tax=Vanilla planifolia TaxID=51239 RepID=A0A835S0Q8_VANPL|nr:hypothetical protein HPP92_001961 [Vanilla planifolia]
MPNAESPFRLNWASFSTGDRRSDVVSDHSIFVGDLASDVTDSMLQEIFASKYPSVKGAKVVVDPNTGRSKGYGFVRFGDENEKTIAMTDMNGVYCSSRPMRIGAATPRKSGGFGINGSSTQSFQSDGDSTNTTVFVGRLDPAVSEDELRQSFSQYGEIASIKIPVGKQCGFVQFVHRNNAEDALQALNGTVLGKQAVRLSWGRNPANKQLRGELSNQWSSAYYGPQMYDAYGFAIPSQDPIFVCHSIRGVILCTGINNNGKQAVRRARPESDPLLEGVDQILAVIDVLLASRCRVGNQPDWYSILQLPHPSSSSSSGGNGSIEIKRGYRRLALLLSSDHNKYPFADSALRLVSEAFAFLSDLERKSLFDAQFRANRCPAATPPPRRSFWTSCPACCHVFEYDRLYVDRTLLCRTCMRPFHASEMVGSPPIVPGTDMYYCAWGFFPLGFPGSGFPNSEAAGTPVFSKDWKPFHPVTPWWGNHAGEQAEEPLNAVPVNVAAAERSEGPNSWRKKSSPTRNRKVVAKRELAIMRGRVLFLEKPIHQDQMDWNPVESEALQLKLHKGRALLTST